MFSASFWENDFISQSGFDTLVSRMKDGRQTCRDVEEFLKQRSKAEEDFAKALLKIAKVDRGADESGTLRSSLETLRYECEMEASGHLTHSQHLQEEANKLSEFREKQREERKRHEDVMHKAHKNKVDNYRRMLSCKTSYESKSKSDEKSESDLERLKFGNKPKEVEKARKIAQQCRQAAAKADEDFQNAIGQLEISRQSWESDHRAACEVFQRLEEERIQYLRNALWVFANLGSDLFVKTDDSRENIRLSLEKCDVRSDIQDFVSRKATGTKPLMPIPYTSCRYTPNPQPTNSNQSSGGRGAIARDTDEYSLAAYAAIGTTARGSAPTTYYALYDYTPRTQDEVELKINDRVTVSSRDEDGWWRGKNARTGREGLFPANYVHEE